MNKKLAFKLAFTVSSLLISAVSSFADDCPTDKFELWTGKHLHGSNIFQGRNPQGGSNGIGDGDFSQADFDDLRAAGANYVQLSHAGTYGEAAPYALDSAVEASLDLTIQRAMSAGLYVVIAFRSGPGRNENTITNRDGVLNEKIWSETAARTAWVAMIRHTAERYQGNPAVVGYSIMVEPNAYARRGFIDPPDFYAQYAGTIEDVNGLHALATAAIREVDTDTPILLEPDGYSALSWLPYLTITGDSRTVYTTHDYAPYEYTHEAMDDLTYPGNYDIDFDGNSELVNKDRLATYLQSLSQFAEDNSVPVAITEFGPHYTATNAAQYLTDRVDLQNPICSWAVWTWQPSGFEDPFNLHDPSETHDALVNAWAGNCTPVFEQPTQTSGMLAGQSLSRRGAPVKGIKVKVDSTKLTTTAEGRYGVTLEAGSYTVSASSKKFRCVVGSTRGPKKLSVTVSTNETTTVNVYCRKK